MAFAKNIMGLGFSAAQASGDFASAIANGLTAAGTTQATALLVSADVNMISTVGAGSGVILYNGMIGDSCTVFNDAGANALTVYPPVGSKINNLATNTGFSLAANTTALLVKVTSTRWVAFLSA